MASGLSASFPDGSHPARARLVDSGPKSTAFLSTPVPPGGPDSLAAIRPFRRSSLASGALTVFRRIFSRFEKRDALFLGFIQFALIVDGVR